MIEHPCSFNFSCRFVFSLFLSLKEKHNFGDLIFGCPMRLMLSDFGMPNYEVFSSLIELPDFWLA